MSAQPSFNIETFLPATFTAPELTEADFLALCETFPDSRLEYSGDGTVIIMPPTDPETAKRNYLIVRRLGDWGEGNGTGSVVGSDGGFLFRNGSRRAPDAAWFNEARWQESRKKGGRYPVFAPEFVIELRSPDDRLRLLQDKMEEYIANGVQLAWLIDPIERKATIYRPGRQPEVLSNPTAMSGEGPVEGFTLSLEGIL